MCVRRRPPLDCIQGRRREQRARDMPQKLDGAALKDVVPAVENVRLKAA